MFLLKNVSTPLSLPLLNYSKYYDDIWFQDALYATLLKLITLSTTEKFLSKSYAQPYRLTCHNKKYISKLTNV